MASIHAVRILVIDDDVEVAEVLAELLQVRGYEVDTELRIDQVREQLKHAAYDVVVSDIRLGAWSGLDLPALVSAALEPKPLLIALTGDYGARAEERSLAAGFDAHFSKPLDLDRLEECIRARKLPQLDAGPSSGPVRTILERPKVEVA